MTRVFISFRNDDEPYGAALVHAVLASWFGGHNVFRSSDSIQPGDDYVRRITEALRRSTVLLAIIGPRWPLARELERRAPGQCDWVQREIATAFANGKRVVPVLLGNRTMPAEEDLPGSISRLARCQYRRLSHRQLGADITMLAADLVSFSPDLARSRDDRRSWTAIDNRQRLSRAPSSRYSYAARHARRPLSS